MRLFVALDLTDAVRAAIAELLAGLKPTTGAVRWVRPDVLHLTLKFIGHLGEEKLPALREALARARTLEPVEMDFHGVGFFSNPRSPRVFWVGVRGNDALFDLAGQIEGALEPLGIARERRSYLPHLTLGRFKSGPGRRVDSRQLTSPARKNRRAALGGFRACALRGIFSLPEQTLPRRRRNTLNWSASGSSEPRSSWGA